MTEVELKSNAASECAIDIPISDSSSEADGGSSKPPGFFSIYSRIMSLATVSEKLLYTIGILCSIGAGVVLPLMTLIFGNFVSVFTDFALGKMQDDVFRSKINHYTLYFIYLFIAKAGTTYVYMVLFTIVATNVNSALRKSYLNVVLYQRIGFHETSLSSGAVTLALSIHSNAIRAGLAEKFGLSLKSTSTVVAGFVVALHSEWRLGLVTATIIPAAVILVGLTSALDEKKEQDLNTINAEAATVAEEVLSTVRTVRALNAEKRLANKYGSILAKAMDIGWSRGPIKGSQAGTYMFSIYGAYALAFWYGMKLYAQNQATSSGAIITTLFSIMIAINAFSELAGYLGAFMRIRSAGIELFKVIDLAPQKNDSKHIDQGPHAYCQPLDIFHRDIQLKEVQFEYPTRKNVHALDQFSLHIPADQTTALVGPSGSGKSTVVGLLLRWYDAAQGEIKIGGNNINEIPLEVLRAHVGLVQQEPYLFSGTVLENIEYGLSGTSMQNLAPEKKRQLAMEACKTSNAHEFILGLPEGYDTHLGNRGSLLSGGQKQRLAIARALVKNPPILILDEATSALDAKSEALVQQGLDNARKNRTTISIAHRLTTIQSADQIVVMRKGTVAEAGTHADLIQLNGTYKRLWDAQTLAKTDRYEPKSQVDLHDQLDYLLLDNQNKNISVVETKTGAPKKGAGKLILGILLSQKRYWWLFLVLFASAVIGGALFPLQAFLYAKVVDTFQLTGRSLVTQGNFWALMWFVLAIVVGIGYLGIGWAGSCLGEVISQQYRYNYFKSIISQSISFFDLTENSSGKLLSRLSTDSDAINSLAGSNIAVLITVGVALISVIVLALAVGWKLGLVVIFGGLPFIFGAGVVHERMENSFERVAEKMFMDSVGFAGECIQAIRTVSALNMEPIVEGRFEDLLEQHCRRATRYAVKAMVWFALSDAIEMLCMALAFWYGGRLLSFHEYSTTQFFTVFISVVFGSQSMGQFFAHSSDISKGISSTRVVLDMEDRLPQTMGTRVIPSLDKWDTRAPFIEFRDTSFRYPTRPEKQVLNQFNMNIYQGQFIALVGPSGCGKSTIIQLLEHFYQVDSGEVLIAGIPIQDIEPEQVRNLFSLVSQEPVLYQGTIEENINLGVQTALSDAELQTVVKQAQLSEMVNSLPDGAKAYVGSRGSAVSGGQKQRIAIARAIAQNAPVLLLDEATSALDSESEHLIQQAIKENSQSKTVISVAHRLSTIQHADCIFVMDGGRVVETGKHDELLRQGGQYWAMVQAQTGLAGI